MKSPFSCLLALGCALLVWPGTLGAQDAEKGRAKLPAPTHANVAYGPHERNVMDVWLADSAEPTPVLVYFHGGGFVTGSKANLPAAVLAAALRAGISVVAANYRLAPGAAFPAPYLDCARAIQFTRHAARSWHLDPARVALTGSSAGAGTALWIAFHDDLADPTSVDPVARESTRVTCVAVRGAQPSYDPRVVRELAGESAARHPVFANLHGLKPDELETAKALKLFAQTAALTHLTADDPPVFAYYSEPRAPVPPGARAGTGIHHPNLGLFLKQKMDALGLECVFLHQDQKINVTAAEGEFLRRHLFPRSALGPGPSLAEPDRSPARAQVVPGGRDLPPGIVIASSPAPDKYFIGSPSLVILPDGGYVAAHDFFGKAGSGSRETRIFHSADRGASWRQLAQFGDSTWGNLFMHAGVLHYLSITGEYGDVTVRRSLDGGRTWTNPVDGRSGRILAGQFHTAPVPVVVQHGRIWRAVEEVVNDRKWPAHFAALVISAPVGADLLEASNWTRTNGIVFDPAWIPGRRPGWLEGNVVVTPQGEVANILRVNTEIGREAAFALTGGAAGIPREEVAARLAVSADGKELGFDPATGFLHLPGSQSKFTIRHDPVSRRYWSLVNKITRPHEDRAQNLEVQAQRNVVVLISSPDLVHWREHRRVLAWRPGEQLTRKDRHAFQYLDWQFDGDDIVAVARTAWNADSFHNANHLTFHRVPDFRAEQGSP